MNLNQIIAIRRFEVMKERRKPIRVDVYQERFMADMLSREQQHKEFLQQSKKLADRQYLAIEQNTTALLDVLGKFVKRGDA